MGRLIFIQAGRPRITLLMTSISTWYRTTDFKLMARKILTYLSVGLIVAPLYVIALFALSHFLNNWTEPSGIATIVVMVFIPLDYDGIEEPCSEKIGSNLLWMETTLPRNHAQSPYQDEEYSQRRRAC